MNPVSQMKMHPSSLAQYFVVERTGQKSLRAISCVASVGETRCQSRRRKVRSKMGEGDGWRREEEKAERVRSDGDAGRGEDEDEEEEEEEESDESFFVGL